LLCVILVSSFHQGCFGSGSSFDCDTRSVASSHDAGCFLFSCIDDNPCPNPPVPPKGPVHGIRPDGRVDVTAAEAWPDRPPPEPVPSPQEVADACAAFEACVDSKSSQTDPPAPPTTNDGRSPDEVACANGGIFAFGPFALNAAERVIPLHGLLESWPFFIRAVAALHGDCAAIKQVLTKRNGAFVCQEDGCWASTTAQAACNGAVSLQDGGARDCSRSGMLCSETSPTGCTDRPLVRCKTGGADRCDGDIKLGCDHCGFVSFHDCTWNGGHCEETNDGAACVAPGDSGI
jgi:hypothetical protein